MAVVLARHTDNRVVELGFARPGGLVELRLDIAAGWRNSNLLDHVAEQIIRTDDAPPAVAVPRCAVLLLGHHEPGLPGSVDRGFLRRHRAELVETEFYAVADQVGSKLELSFHADLFDERTAGRLTDQILLAAAAVEEDGLVEDIDLATPDELERCRATSVAPASSPHKCLPEKVDEHAQSRPDDVAVVLPGQPALTYLELVAQANRLAHRLAELGVAPGDRVGLHIRPSRELVVAVLAILKAGAAYVPVDHRLPASRKQKIVARAGLVLILADSPARFDLVPVEVVALDRPGRPVPPDVRVKPADAAYVLFTSGSTGEPKGVLVSHANVTRLFSTTDELFGAGPRETWLNMHNIGFDASVWEIFGALWRGGRVIVCPQETARDPEALLGLVRDEAVTMLTISPTAFDGFREAALRHDAAFPALRHVVLCAEPLTTAALAPWFDRWGDEQPRLVNMYGITETTVHSTFHRLSREDVRHGRCVIGKGLPDTPIYLLDARGRRVPLGVPGEIHVGGPGVSSGYLIAEPADHGRFVPDLFAELPDTRMYRSGDRGRLLPDGTIEYLGRADRQVKIRGHRIELGDVEAALLAHPEVRSARAWVVREEDRPHRIAAAVVGTADLNALRGFATDRLPEYMVPAGFVSIEELPQTVNGKFDSAALPNPFTSRAGEPAEAASNPSSASEHRIAEVMAEVLGLPELDVTANFFERGGDSITAVRLVTSLRRAGFEARVEDVYQQRTPKALAGTVSEPSGPEAHDSPAGTAVLPGEIPATRLQRGMFLHSVLDGEAVYHDVLSYTVDRLHDEFAFSEAVRLVVAGNPTLRSGFLIDGRVEPLQVFHEHADIACTFADLAHLSATEQRAWLDEWAAAESTTPFDWAEPGLLRIFVHHLGPDRSTLSLSVHHAVLDGWSAASLVTELLVTYTALRFSRKPRSKPRTALLATYVELERAAESDEAHQRFWREFTEGVRPPLVEALTDGVGPTGADVAELTWDIPGSTSTAVRKLAAQIGVPPKSAYLAVHLAAQAFLSAEPDVVTGLVTSCRVEEEGGDTELGLFLNTLPLRLRVEDQSWTELVRDVFEQESAIYPHRRFPFERIQALTTEQRLCPIAFNYTDFHVYERLLDQNIRLHEVRYRENTDFRLLVSVHETPFGGATTVNVSYKTAPGAEAQARLYLRCVQHLLDQVEAGHDQAVGSELAAWAFDHGHAIEVPPGTVTESSAMLLARFAERVRAQPGQTALEHLGTSWSFLDVARRVNAIRSELLAAGVTPGSRIACCVERGINALVVLLGTWAAGATYVPIDAGLPEQRRRLLTAKAGCTVAVRSPDVPPDLVDVPGPVLVPGEPAASPEFGLWHSPAADAEAYVLFTSGSSGEPKAVSVPHGAITNIVTWQAGQPEFVGPRRTSQFAPLSFDASLQEMLTSVITGSTLCVVPDDHRRDPKALLRFLADEMVEISFLPPVVLHQLATAAKTFELVPSALTDVICAGEELIVTEDIRDLSRAAGFTLVNQYGPTETHVATQHRLAPAPESWPHRPPIGGMIGNVSALVLDPAGRPVPARARGELYIGGAGVALGYVDGSELHPLTAERFVELDGRRYYRTGDVVRFTRGELEFLGRADDQVKIRGFRVEPAEVAAAFLRHPSVRNCAVRPFDQAGQGRVLVAYVVAQPGTTRDRLLGHAKSLLPEHAVPQHIELIDQMPMTQSGKVDVRALRPPRPVRPRPGVSRALTPLQRRVLGVWQKVLGFAVPSPDITFFDAGGSSLTLFTLYLKLRKEFPAANFEMNHLFHHSTARAFATFLDQRPPAPAEVAPPPPGQAQRAARIAGRRRSLRGSEINGD